MTVSAGVDSAHAVRQSSRSLAAALTVLRQESGLTVEQFEARTGISALRARMVEQGRMGADPATLTAYLRLLGATPGARGWLEELRDRFRATELSGVVNLVVDALEREHARRVAQAKSKTRIITADGKNRAVNHAVAKQVPRRRNEVSQADPALWPRPDAVRTLADFTAAMATIKASTGLSYQSLADVSTGYEHPFARSTVQALCTRPKLPNAKTLGCFISICGGGAQDVHAWNAVWQRLAQGEHGPTPKPVTVEQQAAGAPSVPVDHAQIRTFIVVLWVMSLLLAVAITLVVARPEMLSRF